MGMEAPPRRKIRRKRRIKLISSWEGEIMPRQRLSPEEKRRQEIITLKAKGAIDQREMNRRLKRLGLEEAKSKGLFRRILNFMTP